MLSNFVPGSSNCIADALSRFQIQRCRELAPGAAISSTVGDTLDSSLDDLWRQSISNNTQTAYKKSLKIPKGQSESIYRRITDNTMAKRKRTKGQKTIYKTYI